jgi:hypothetical protein
VCSADLKRSAIFSQDIYEYISVTANSKFTYFLIKGIMLIRNKFFNWRYVYFAWPLEYLMKKLPVPTKRAIIISGKVRSSIALLLLLLVCIRSYIHTQFWYINVWFRIRIIQKIYIYVNKGVAILDYFSKPKGVREQRRMKNTSLECRLLLLVFGFAGIFRLDKNNRNCNSNKNLFLWRYSTNQS